MLIVADSGSTYIDWRIIRDNGSATAVCTAGVNPVYQGINEIVPIFKEAFGAFSEEKFSLYFYGAGVVSPNVVQEIHKAVEKIAPQATVYVGSDQEAAGIAMFGSGSGVVGILGTGSNSALYLNGKIEENIPAGGFILGDEGSGAWMGKHLLGDYIKGILPEKMHRALEERYALSYADIVQKVYRESMPSRYLASFCIFLKEHIGDEYVKRLIESAFAAYFERNLQRYAHRGLPLGMIGSVAVEFEDVFTSIAKHYGFEDVRIARSAADGLERYYRNKYDLKIK